MRISSGLNSKCGREVTGCEGEGVRVREQLITVWVVAGGGSWGVLSRAAGNSYYHQTYASLDHDLGEPSYLRLLLVLHS